jgi:hypothetical protein
MAAATVDYARTVVAGSDFLLQEIRLSSLTSDQAEDVAHGGPSGVAPLLVLSSVTTAATTGDQITVEHHKASDSTTNNTMRVKARVAAGGDISGAKVTLYALFIGRASGGLNP